MVAIQPYRPDLVIPSSEVVQALESGVVDVTRRVEIYESDAVTRWYPEGGADDEVSRLIGGTVTLDYNSDERRKLDLVLNNSDGLLRQRPEVGFWYDKVLKIYYGISYKSLDVSPALAIIESQGGTLAAEQLKGILGSFGLTNNNALLGQTDLGVLNKYSWIVSYMSNSATGVAPLLSTLFAQGKNIITIGVGNGTGQLPHYATAPTSSTQFGIAPVAADTATSGAFVAESVGTPVLGTVPTAVVGGAQALAAYPPAPSSTMVTAAFLHGQNGAIWLDIHLPSIVGIETRKLFRAAVRYMRNYVPVRSWEAQLGEFYIDNLSEDNFPHHMSITGRDATKKLMLSKLSRTSSYPAGTSLSTFVIAEASLAGIPVNKMRFNFGTEVFSSEMSFDKGTPRWDMIKSALDSFGYERFFDGSGFFVVRKYLDPSTSPTNMTFKTGSDGNLVKFSRSTNDSRIFNHVIVNSTPVDGNAIPLFGEAINDDPGSPTRRARLGDRVQSIDADWLDSDDACVALAQQRLKISGLESYELNFSSIYYPWLECGEISEVLDPDALSFDPTRFLLDSIEYPLDLGPMSATGKRVTLVNPS